ncbi:MAG: alpha/beta fold hydrolase, partial [Bacteroidales bacterium]
MKTHIDFKGKKIHFKDEGEGPVLVLLHGFLESLHIWDDFAAELTGSFRVVRIDLPGHGQTEVIDGKSGMTLMAKAVKAVLDELAIAECVMIGHSMGGYVTLEFALQFGGMLRGLG